MDGCMEGSLDWMIQLIVLFLFGEVSSFSFSSSETEVKQRLKAFPPLLPSRYVMLCARA